MQTTSINCPSCNLSGIARAPTLNCTSPPAFLFPSPTSPRRRNPAWIGRRKRNPYWYSGVSFSRPLPSHCCEQVPNPYCDLRAYAEPRFSAIIRPSNRQGSAGSPMFSVCQTCYDVLLLNLRGFCTVFGFSLFGRVGVIPLSGISQWYRVSDAGALRAEPLATLCLARSKFKQKTTPKEYFTTKLPRTTTGHAHGTGAHWH